MTPFIQLLTVSVTLLVCVSLAWANPALLPKHEGYPMDKATSPVTGQALTNDPGQQIVAVDKALTEAAASEDAHVTQKLTNPDDKRLIEKPGAGVLPKVEGPQIKIEPPVTEATRMK